MSLPQWKPTQTFQQGKIKFIEISNEKSKLTIIAYDEIKAKYVTQSNQVSFHL